MDFHNKSRVPLFLVPKDTKSEVASYSRDIIRKMLSTVCLESYEVKPIGYAPMVIPFEKTYTFLNEVLQLFLIPSSRWIVFGEKCGKN